MDPQNVFNCVNNELNQCNNSHSVRKKLFKSIFVLKYYIFRFTRLFKTTDPIS